MRRRAFSLCAIRGLDLAPWFRLARPRRQASGGFGRSAKLFGNFFGFFGFEIQGKLYSAICFHIDAHHPQIRRPDLKVGGNLAFFVDAHDPIPDIPSHSPYRPLKGRASQGLAKSPLRCLPVRMNPTLRPFHPEDTDWLVSRHGALYAQEEGFDDSFPKLVRAILTDFIAQRDPATEQGWIAQDGQERLGSIFCVREGQDHPTRAKLRLFLIEPSARGTGLAQTMIETCLGFAKAKGYRQMRLWTHESQLAACRLYARNGFSCVESAPTRSFGQDVVTQIWERML